MLFAKCTSSHPFDINHGVGAFRTCSLKSVNLPLPTFILVFSHFTSSETNTHYYAILNVHAVSISIMTFLYNSLCLRFEFSNTYDLVCYPMYHLI
jgi:hypothetical protein